MTTPQGMFARSLAALLLLIALSPGAQAQYRDRGPGPQAAPGDSDNQPDRDRSRRMPPDSRQSRPDMSAPQNRPQRRDTRRDAVPDRQQPRANQDRGQRRQETQDRGQRRQETQGRDQRRQESQGRDQRRQESQGRDQRRQETQGRDQRRQETQGRDQRRQETQGRDQRRQETQGRDQRRRETQGRDQRRDFGRDRDRRQAPQRRLYERRPEQNWHREGPGPRERVYIPHRWSYRDRPYHRNLWSHHYGRVWWCGVDCRIALLFGFGVWAVDTVVSDQSGYSFPVWEALEYNRTGETSLWESGWGYVEFTPIRTYRRPVGRFVRDCRDFRRVVVRNDGLERRYEGTACRNLAGSWWILSSYRVS